MRMYSMISARATTKIELEEYYDMDEFVKQYAVWRMMEDVKAAKLEEAAKKK